MKYIHPKLGREAEELYGDFRKAREDKNRIKAILDLIQSLIISLRVKNKHLDHIQ